MTRPTSASPRKAAVTLDDATDAKLKFISAAYAASPLRAVEKYPWTAVATTAAATMGVTAISGSPLFKVASSGFFKQGMSIVASLLKSQLGAAIAQDVAQGVQSEDPPVTHS
ncbi:MAG: hypothetical protein QM754_10995 [Tepidisphaeraceae bacterium]